MLQTEVKAFFREHEDKANAEFQKRIVVTNYYVYGLKTSVIENYAKDLVKNGVTAKQLPLDSFEEILLAGMVLAKTKTPPNEKIEFLDKLIVHFDNWAHCDMIVSRLKGLESQRQYFESLLLRKNPFELRVGIIWLMAFVVRKNPRDGIDKILSVQHENYYVKMAQAWAVAEAGVKDYDYIYNVVQKIDDRFIRNKSISKMCDSFRINTIQKNELKKLRI